MRGKRSRGRGPFELALALSLCLHLAVLLIPLRQARQSGRPSGRLQATLASAPEAVSHMPKAAAPHAMARSILSVDRPQAAQPTFSVPKWSEQEKAEMSEFLADLEREARARPSLAQSSLAMAREMGRLMARQDDGQGETVERLPDSPPVDPFSLDFYLDALVKKLNRSSAFVENRNRKSGVKTAAVRFRLKPDGTLESLTILNAADQQEEIEYIKAVIRAAAPFSPFPADLTASAGSIAMVICIKPASAEGNFGFTRVTGKGC